MRNTRLALVVVALLAIGFAAFSSFGDSGDEASNGGGDSAPATTSGPAPADAIKLILAFSPEKEEMMKALLPRFNAEGVEVEGRPVVAEGQKWSSGDAQTRIAKGTLKPQIWSPSSSLWGRLLNFQADRTYVADENPSLVRTPLVVAMWEPLARALGWPGKPIGFDTILELATSQRGWAAYGKPTFGSFKLGHTNPDFSTSGLSFVAAQYYTAAGKREGLTLADVDRGPVRRRVRQIQSSIVHYGDTTLFFADQLKANGPGYASAVAMEEATLLDYNRTRPKGSLKLVAIYPSDGTFVSDNPFLVLDAPWVSEAQAAGARALGIWLARQLTPELAARYGFRPGDPDARALPPITRANGVDPAQPARVLSLPEPRVLNRIKRAWREDRKPANLMLVVDVSGSMQEEDKIGQARQGLQVFLRQLSPRDRVGLLTFSSDASEVVPIAPFAGNRGTLRARVNELIADGDTALYDATSAGWNAVDKLGDDARINAVVVLSDGADTASRSPLQSVVRQLAARARGEGRQIRVFTIAYGAAANKQVLADIAAASGGKAYAGDPDDIEAVYLQISSFF